MSLFSLPRNAFRANVGAMILNESGQVLAFQRADASAAWQMPQGGIEAHEEPVEALFREVEEETNLPAEALELVAEHPDWLAYEIPKEKGFSARGQAQKWFVLRLTGSTEQIDLERASETEFIAWKWTTLNELIEITIDFKRPVYRKLAQNFADYLAD